MEQLAIPPALTDSIFSLLFVFVAISCILMGLSGGEERELKLALPEVEKNMAQDREAPEEGSAEIRIYKTGRITVDGTEVRDSGAVSGVITGGGSVGIAFERGADGALLIEVEARLKKLGIREVRVAVKEKGSI